MRPNLVAVPDSGLHDLPPRWDGLPVAWRGWRTITGHICPPGRDACSSCGSLEHPTINFGLLADDPAMTPEEAAHDDRATLLAHRSRHRRQRRTWIKLTALRCVECGHDQVLDAEGNLWDLDLSDYDDRGSTDPREDQT